eukprot:GDKI01010077.1.p1 GENE.GDKI01010077.1~~GDKI01010077.1.p1  ORF type:complete len:194 (-),score=41.11 GDKI01010077.1:25-585(-)
MENEGWEKRKEELPLALPLSPTHRGRPEAHRMPSPDNLIVCEPEVFGLFVCDAGGGRTPVMRVVVKLKGIARSTTEVPLTGMFVRTYPWGTTKEQAILLQDHPSTPIVTYTHMHKTDEPFRLEIPVRVKRGMDSWGKRLQGSIYAFISYYTLSPDGKICAEGRRRMVEVCVCGMGEGLVRGMVVGF